MFPFALVFYEIVTYLSNDMYLPSLPTLVTDFQTTENIAQYTLLSWFLGSASLQFIIGPLADRFGRRTILLTGVVCFILSTLLCATTHSSITMLLARFIQGSTVCAVVVAGYSAIHEKYDTLSAIKIISIMGAVTFLAPALGPLIGAVIIDISHWRMIFWLLAGLGILGGGLLFFVMPETNPQPVTIHFKKILRDYFLIIKRRAFLTYILPLCFLWVSLISWLVEAPFILIDTYQLPVLHYGFIQLIVSGGFMLGAQITHLLMRKYQPITMIQLGLTLNVLIAFIMIITAALGLQYVYWNVFLVTMISVGGAIAFGPLNRLAVEACFEPMGRRMAVSSTFQNIFCVLGIILVNIFEENTMNGLCVLIALNALMGFTVFCILLQKKT